MCYCWLWGFFSCSGVPKILQSTFTLPLALVCVPSSPAKTTKFKITLDTNQAPVQLSSIFSGNAHQDTADTLQGRRPVRALVARVNASQKIPDNVKRQKCWGITGVFERIFKIPPQNQTGGDADEVLYILCIIVTEEQFPLFGVNTCVLTCPFSHGNICAIWQSNVPEHTLFVYPEVCVCVCTQICRIVSFVNCVTVSLRPLLASYLDIDRPICLITLSLCPSLLSPLSPPPPSLSHSPHTLEFSIKSEDKDGNSLAFQFLPGPKVTLLASKTSRESDNNRWDFHRTHWSVSMKWHHCSLQNMGICQSQLGKTVICSVAVVRRSERVCVFVRALSDTKWQFWGHVVGGEGAGPEIRPVFLQTGSQRLQKKLQWSTPTARVLPVCWPSLPGIYQYFVFYCKLKLAAAADSEETNEKNNHVCCCVLLG